MHPHYGYYYAAPSPGAVAGGATAAATGSGHVDPEGFMGLNWKSIMVAVAVGSLTAILTQLTLEYVKDRKEAGKKPKHRALTFAE